MRLSEEKISHIAHLIRDGLQKGNCVEYHNSIEALKTIKKALLDYLKIDDELDQVVQQKISTLKRGVHQGSREWDVLYSQYYKEEERKRGF